jgi:hypothetical protein
MIDKYLQKRKINIEGWFEYPPLPINMTLIKSKYDRWFDQLKKLFLIWSLIVSKTIYSFA